MLSQLGRRNPRFFSGRRSRRSPLADLDLILWGVPLAMVAIAGILIASTQRQANYADWYQHWVTAAVGMVVDAAAPAAIPVVTEVMVAERTGLVVEEGTVQAMTVEAMTVGTTAWLFQVSMFKLTQSTVVQH